jgi:hypothetical protein
MFGMAPVACSAKTVLFIPAIPISQASQAIIQSIRPTTICVEWVPLKIRVSTHTAVTGAATAGIAMAACIFTTTISWQV